MTAVTLPALPPMTKASPIPREFAAKLTPPSGGQEQRIARLGDRWMVRYTLPALPAAFALAVQSAQGRARTEGLTIRCAFPVPPGAPTGLEGVGSVNSTLISVEDPPEAALDRFFSFESGGHAYLHQVTAINADSLSVAPRLRATVAGALNFVDPVVEGFLDGASGWDIERLAHTGVTFTISEDR